VSARLCRWFLLRPFSNDLVLQANQALPFRPAPNVCKSVRLRFGGVVAGAEHYFRRLRIARGQDFFVLT
jgi:hypothetical protein